MKEGYKVGPRESWTDKSHASKGKNLEMKKPSDLAFVDPDKIAVSAVVVRPCSVQLHGSDLSPSDFVLYPSCSIPRQMNSSNLDIHETASSQTSTLEGVLNFITLSRGGEASTRSNLGNVMMLRE